MLKKSIISILLMLCTSTIMAQKKVIVGPEFICPASIYKYEIKNTNKKNVFNWEIIGGVFAKNNNSSSVEVSFSPKKEKYILKAWEIDKKSNSVKSDTIFKLIKKPNFILKINDLNKNSDTIFASHCSLFETNYSEAERYFWFIKPKEAGNIIENGLPNVKILWNELQNDKEISLNVYAYKCDLIYAKDKIILLKPSKTTTKIKDTICENLPDARFIYSDTGCEKVAFDFKVKNPKKGQTYMWEASNGIKNYNQNPNFVFFEPNTYWVKLTVLSPNGCSKSSTKSITVYANNIQGNLYQYKSKKGENIIEYLNSSHAQMPSKFEWMRDNNLIATTKNSKIRITKSGNYWVKVTDETGCKKEFLNKLTVAINPTFKSIKK